MCSNYLLHLHFHSNIFYIQGELVLPSHILSIPILPRVPARSVLSWSLLLKIYRELV